MLLRTLSLIAFSIAAPAGAQDATKPAEPVKERKICRKAMPTGSTIPKSVCRTKAEWEALGQQGRRDADGIRERPLGTPQVPRG